MISAVPPTSEISQWVATLEPENTSFFTRRGVCIQTVATTKKWIALSKDQEHPIYKQIFNLATKKLPFDERELKKVNCYLGCILLALVGTMVTVVGKIENRRMLTAAGVIITLVACLLSVFTWGWYYLQEVKYQKEREEIALSIVGIQKLL